MSDEPSYSRFSIQIVREPSGDLQVFIRPDILNGQPHSTAATQSPDEISSPIYRIDGGDSAVPAAQHWHLVFGAVARPLRYAHAITRACNKLGISTYVSLGIASFVLVCPSPETRDAIKASLASVAGPDFRGVESWDLDGQTVIDTDYSLEPAVEATQEILITEVDYERLPVEARWVCDELASLYIETRAKSGQWAPVFLPQIEAVFAESKQCLAELLVALNGGQSLQAQASFNQTKSQLINHCAALSYLSSQGLSCALPLKSSECYFRRHAFLGISQAMQGVSALEGDVCAKFRFTTVEPLIEIVYAAQPLGAPFHRHGRYDDFRFIRSDLRAAHAVISQQVMRLAQNEQADERHITYFSTRHGFKWSGKSITIPSEVLENAAALPWNLLTITHEMLHCHVYSVLSVILGRSAAGDQADAWLHENVAAYLRWTEHHNSDLPQNVRDALRYRIFEFAENYSGLTTDAVRSLGENGTGIVDLTCFEGHADALRRLDNAFKMLNEIVVHTLDLNYFYRNNTREYLRLIWSSWSRVPQVSFSLKQYLVRSLAAIATVQERGTQTMRFDWALEQVRTALRELSADPAIAAIHEAVESICSQQEHRESVQENFMLCLSMVDDVIRYLFIEDTNRRIENSGNALREGDIYVPPAASEIPSSITAYPLEIARGYFIGRALGASADVPESWAGFKILLHLASADQESH